jgi:hypothetical protein
MSTRSTYRISSSHTDKETGKTKVTHYCLVYVQCDGYPEGHPVDTAKWLSGGEVVNGIPFNDDKQRTLFNGPGCLAAQLVAYLKDGAGNVYLNPVSTRGTSWEDYLYDIITNDDFSITFIARSNHGRKPIFYKGTPEGFVEWVEKKQLKEEEA